MATTTKQYSTTIEVDDVTLRDLDGIVEKIQEVASALSTSLPKTSHSSRGRPGAAVEDLWDLSTTCDELADSISSYTGCGVYLDKRCLLDERREAGSFPFTEALAAHAQVINKLTSHVQQLTTVVAVLNAEIVASKRVTADGRQRDRAEAKRREQETATLERCLEDAKRRLSLAQKRPLVPSGPPDLRPGHHRKQLLRRLRSVVRLPL